MNHHAHAQPELVDSSAGPLMIPPHEAALALLEARRSVPLRTLAGPGPTPDELDRLMTLAARTPGPWPS